MRSYHTWWIREDRRPSILLDPHHCGHGPVGFGHDVKGARLQVVAAENSLVGLKGLFIGPLVPVAEISPAPLW